MFPALQTLACTSSSVCTPRYTVIPHLSSLQTSICASSSVCTPKYTGKFTIVTCTGWDSSGPNYSRGSRPILSPYKVSTAVETGVLVDFRFKYLYGCLPSGSCNVKLNFFFAFYHFCCMCLMSFLSTIVKHSSI